MVCSSILVQSSEYWPSEFRRQKIINLKFIKSWCSIFLLKDSSNGIERRALRNRRGKTRRIIENLEKNHTVKKPTTIINIHQYITDKSTGNISRKREALAQGQSTKGAERNRSVEDVVEKCHPN